MSLRIGQGLALRVRPTVGLAPALRQSMGLLRMSQQELADEIRRELACNPFLTCHASDRRRPGPEVPLGALAAPKPSLFQSICDQIGMMKLPAPVRALALRLLAELRPDGYLPPETCPQLAQQGVAPDVLNAALNALQRCDPPGVGARSLAECLELQLRDLGLCAEAAARSVAALPLLARGDHAGAAACMCTDPSEAARRAQLVRRLRALPVPPDPGPRLDAPPDIEVTLLAARGGDAAQIRDGAPRLTVDSALAASARDAGFAPEQLTRAEALVSALRFRKDTLTRIALALVRHQRRAIADGQGALRPLTQRAVAQALKLHPSTVSRAVAGKTMAVNGRVWSMAALFSNALPVAGTDVLAAAAVRERLRQLIAAEPPHRPLSDVALAQLLATEGVDIARRTVTKYREMLRIPGSAERRARAPAAALRDHRRQRRFKTVAGAAEQSATH